MAPFDPIRDSAASSNPAASPTMPRTNSSSSFGADEDGNEEGHYRRPSRSASIMSILNPTPSSPVGGERPSSSASRHASPPLRPSRMSIHGLVTPSSPHGQPTPPPAAQHTSSRSPSLPIANVLNPSPMIRGSARPSFSSTSQHLYEGGPPSSSSSSSSEYFHPRPLPLQVDPRSPPVPGLMPQFASRWATSPTEAVPPPPPQQYYESPTGGSVVPLPPHHHAAAYPMYDQHPRGRDGFRVPSLPSHRSPDLVKATLPPLTPGGSASNYHQPYAYSPASTPGGYGSVPPPNEFYPPTTPGAGGSGSNYGGPISAHPPPLTPGVPLTPGGSGEPREGYYAWPPVRRDGPEEVAARERTSSYTSAQGWVGGKPVSADDVRQEEAEDAAPKSAEKPPAKKKAKRPSASSSSSKGPAEKADHGEDLKATKTASPTTAQRRTSKPKIDAVFPGTVIPAAEVSAGSEIASSGLPSASSMPSPSPSSATPSTSTSASATTVPRKVKALDLEEMEQLANRDGPMGKKRKSSTANAATDTVEAKSGATEAAGVEATTAKKPRLPLPPRPATAGAGEDDEMQDREPSPSAANGVAATIKQEPSASASSPLPVSTSSSIAPPAPLLSSSPSSSTTIAYQPTRRVSRADGVMRPISRDQLIHLHEVIQMRGSNKLREVWRREQREMGRDDRDGFWEILVPGWGSASSVGHKTGSDGNSNGAAVTRGHRNGAVTPAGSIKYENAPDEVARHYNNRQEVGMQARDQSPILALKNFNNWVKSILIGTNGTRGGRAMDLGGGKGGDLAKWDKLGIRDLLLADIAATSVEQAEARYRERSYRFSASFHALDCFGESLADKLPPEVLREPFDIVSLQFCMHYGWSSPQKARQVLENVSRWLARGGTFVGTIPNQEELYSRLDALPPGELTFGNSKYHVTFSNSGPRKPFGDEYTFYLTDAVDSVPEYVVDWSSFVSLAAEYGLELILKATMAEMWDRFRVDPRHGDLARRMKVSRRPAQERGGKPEEMDPELWEATTVYQAFAFRKR